MGVVVDRDARNRDAPRGYKWAMVTPRTLLLIGLLAGGLLASLGCGAGSPGRGAADASDDLGEAAVLGPGHLGIKSAQCDACHALPVEDHAAVRSPECAACHGANGACDPNGLYSVRVHVAADACTGCHGLQHGHAADADCVACHFADRGLDDTCGEPVDDPGGGLRPESELTHGCTGWPEAPFTPRNAARVTLGLRAGEAAVDFTLPAPDGAPVRLADLLASRPVALVTGAFT